MAFLAVEAVPEIAEGVEVAAPIIEREGWTIASKLEKLVGHVDSSASQIDKLTGSVNNFKSSFGNLQNSLVGEKPRDKNTDEKPSDNTEKALAIQNNNNDYVSVPKNVYDRYADIMNQYKNFYKHD